MKKIIYKKLIKDISLFFLISTISVSTIIWIIQAVNYLDLVSEDGHSIKIYFLFTIFSLPKIISKILPFIFMISLFFTIVRYELRNELIIFWLTGLSKINFINILFFVSFGYMLIQFTLTTFAVPFTLDKGRSFFKSSNIDLFSSIIKERKFNDTVKNLTIFIQTKNNNNLKNIIIKEKLDENKSQIIIAKSGSIFNNNENNKIILFDGKIINHENKNQNIVDFSEFSLDLSKFKSTTITNPKTQEMDSYKLTKCFIKMLTNNKLYNYNDKEVYFNGCDAKIVNSITEEFLKRFISPIFIVLLSLSTSFIIFNKKENNNFRFINVIIFLTSLCFIFFSEIGLSFASVSFRNTIIYISFPIILAIMIYSYFIFNYKFSKGN